MGKKNLMQAAGIVMIISLLSKVTGLIRDALIAYSFGTTYKTDAYTMALTIPNVIFGIVGLAITTTFIPLLVETNKKQNRDEMYKFANSVMNLLLIISIILFIIGFFLTPTLVTLFAPKFTGKSRELTILLTKLSVINLLFLSMNSSFTAMLQTVDEFTAPALVGIAMNLPIIAYILVGNHYGIVGLMVATLIGDGLQIIIQLPWLIKNKYKYSFAINLKDERLKRLMLLIAPVIIGTGVNQIDTLVQNNMASGLAKGSVASLDYANKLFGLLYFTFASAIVTVIFPALTREGASEDFTVFKEHLNSAVNNINLIIMPASLALLILRVPIISILFERGKFNQRSVNMTSEALAFLLIGMVFWGVRDVFNRAFYAIQDTKTPMKNGVFAVLCDIVLSILLVNVMGIGGLTFSTSLSAIISCILLVTALRKKIGEVNGKKILASSIRIFLSSAIMGIVIFGINYVLKSRMIGLKGQILEMLICAIVGIVVYVVTLWAFKVREFMVIFLTIKNRLLPSKTQD